MVAEEILEKGTIETLKKAGLASRNATPLGLGLTIAASSVSTIGEQGFEKENRLAQQLGVTRNDILKLSSDEKEKLFKLFEDNKRNQLVKEQEEISLGEQMRNLSTPPTVSNMRMLDNGNTSTDRTGQI
jgi:outer membrane lipopolysaccharide assembly protein LptE/RlpB